MLNFKTISCTLFLALLLTPQVSFSSASDYQYKKVDAFQTLEKYPSIEAFEGSVATYVKDCLDNTGGGSGAVPCFIGYDIWDRELNIYYKRLTEILSPAEKKALVESQLAWLKERDSAIKFNSLLLDTKYPSTGTMYIAMRAGDAEDVVTPIIKQRALLLKQWLEYVKRKGF